MLQIGYIKARVYTSDAQIPIKNAVFNVFKTDGDKYTLIGTRITDEEGQTSVVPVETPDSSLSQYKGNPDPFTSVSIRIDHPDFKTYISNGVQVFGGMVSIQEAFLLPVDRNVPTDARAEVFDIPKQNL